MPQSEDRPQGRPEGPDREEAVDRRTGRSAARARIEHQASWVDQQVRVAMAKGEFDNLPAPASRSATSAASTTSTGGFKKLIEREQITGVLLPALALRKEDAGLDAVLDRESAEKVVRELLEDFNRRVVEARRQLQGGAPVITKTRDVDAEVAAWRQRRTTRR